MKALGFLVHDVLEHPVCGVLWILGLAIKPLGWVADNLHDATVFKCNEKDEVWISPDGLDRLTDGEVQEALLEADKLIAEFGPNR